MNRPSILTERIFMVVALAALLVLAMAAGTVVSVSADTVYTITLADPVTDSDGHPVFTFTSTPEGASFECSLLNLTGFTSGFPFSFNMISDWTPCTSPYDLGPLADGVYFFSVRITGTTDEASMAMKVLALGADLPTGTAFASPDSAPQQMHYDTQATFTFHSIPEGVATYCKFGLASNAGSLAWEPCTSPTTYSDLVIGNDYYFGVKAEGQPDYNFASFTFHVAWPLIAIDAPYPNPDSTEATLYFHSTPAGAALQCALTYEGETSVTWIDPCTSPQAFTGLVPGRHYFFAVKAKGDEDWISMAYKDWVVTPAVTSITSGPSDTSYSRTATIEFSSNPAVPLYQCALVAGGTTSMDMYDCTSPQEFTDLTYGTTYTFAVAAKGTPPYIYLPPIGLPFPVPPLDTSKYYAIRTWTVQQPTVTINSGPSGTVFSSDVAFEFSNPGDVPMECGLGSNGGFPDWSDCSSPMNYTGLEAGSYLFGVRVEGAADGLATTRDFIVAQSGQSISFGPLANKTYGDAPFTISASASSGLSVSFSAEGACTVSGSIVSLTGAGSCTVTASQSGDASWSPATPAAQSFDIARQTASVTALSGDKYYGDSNPPLNAVVLGSVSGDPINYTLSTTAAQLSGLGDYPIVVTLGSNPNYTVTAGNGVLHIYPREATIWADYKFITYGGEIPALTATVTGAVPGGDPVKYDLSTTAGTLSSAGSYPIVVELGNNPNYALTKQDGILTIRQKAATITAHDETKIYGDANPALTAMVTGQVAGGDAITFSLSTTAETLSDVGTYPISVAPGSNPNYNITPANGTLTINRRDASVAAESKSKTYGDENPPLTAVATGQVQGGAAIEYSLSTAAGDCAHVGSYPITVTLGTNGNYNVTAAGATLTINKRDAAVTARNMTKTYGQDNPTLTATVIGAAASCSAIDYSLSTTAEKLSGVGDYPILVSLGTNSDYQVSKADGSLTIQPASLTVTADNQTVVYSDPFTGTLTFTYDGWITGEGPTSPFLTKAPVCATVGTSTSPAGSYAITCSGGAAPNYEITYVPGTFKVTKESTAITYTGDTLISTAKVGTKATVKLSATLEEEQDSALGSRLSGQRILFRVYSFGDTSLSAPLASCTATMGSVFNGKGYGSCTVSLAAADPYQVKVSLIDNTYYTADVEVLAVMVSDPGTGRTVGGGWLIDPSTNTRANFAFGAKFLNNGKVQGNSLYIYKLTSDLSTFVSGAPAGERAYDFIIKSNALTGLTIYNCPAGAKSGCKATLAGKSTIQAVDRLTGVMYSVGGNYQFQLDVTDNGEPASASTPPDQYAIRAWSASGIYYMLGSSYDANGKLLAPMAIAGGNIQVKGK